MLASEILIAASIIGLLVICAAIALFSSNYLGKICADKLEEAEKIRFQRAKSTRKPS